MFHLIDECCGKGLVGVAESEGHVAQRTVDIEALRRGATDAEIFAFARQHGACVVTINQADFLQLSDSPPHDVALILLPSVRAPELAKLFRLALRALAAMAPSASRILQVTADGLVTALRA